MFLLHLGLCTIPAHILLLEGGAAEEAQVGHPCHEEGASSDQRTGSVREVGEAETERGQGAQ